MANELIETTATELRDTYLRCREMHLQLLREGTYDKEPAKLAAIWDGGTDARGVAHKGVWTRLARSAVSQSLDPVAWVETLFASMYLFSHFPRPTDLEHADIVRMSREWSARLAVEAVHQIRTEWQTALMELWSRKRFSALSADREARAAVADPLLAISPLTRYLLACHCGIGDLAKVIEPAAIRQYLAAPAAYDQAMTDAIPRITEISRKARLTAMDTRKAEELVEAPLIESRLSREQRCLMMACLLSDVILFATARMRLRPDYINQFDEIGLRAVWVTALKLSEQLGVGFLFTNRKQAWQAMDTEIKTLFQTQRDAYPLDVWDQLFGEEGFVSWVYGCDAAEFNSRYGMRLLVKFLRERAVNDPLQRLNDSTRGAVVTNFSQIVRGLAEQERVIATLGGDPVKSGAPTGWLPPVSQQRPTGLAWLDRFLDGGHRAPETYGVLGVIGSGKTTLGLQICQSVAMMEEFLASGSPEAKKILKGLGLNPDEPYPMGYAYYFHYEMSEDDIRTKLWSSAAMIDYKKIRQIGSPGFPGLSTSAELSVDEMALLNATSLMKELDLSAADFPGEQERLERAKYRLAKNFRMIDCTGNDSSNPGLGMGYIPEIASILAGESQKGLRPAVVVIDYAQACVERHTDDEKAIYRLLSQFGRRCEHEIGVPFNTPVWIFQQLSGEANLRTAASKQHHGNAMGSRRFAENCWFAFNVGTADEKTGCRYFTCSKARRSSLGIPPILKIANGFNRLIDVSSQYRFERNGRVVSNAETAEKAKAAGGKNGKAEPKAGRSQFST